MEEHCSAFRHLGYRKQIAPIAQRGMAELLLGISVNSSDVVAGIYDIISHGFYKHSIRHFLMQIPKHLSRPNEFSPFLKPYVSDKFNTIIGTEWHEQIIGSFFRYYLIRFPLLVLRIRPTGWPTDIGVSEEDLEETARYAVTRFERYFPIAAKRVLASDPGDPRGILYEFMVGKEIASQYEAESDTIQEFLYEHGAVWDDLMVGLPRLSNSNILNSEVNYNVITFFEAVFRDNFRLFWDCYRSDYLDTIFQWSTAGAFEGDENKPMIRGYWEELEKHLEQNEFTVERPELR